MPYYSGPAKRIEDDTKETISKVENLLKVFGLTDEEMLVAMHKIHMYGLDCGIAVYKYINEQENRG